MVTSADLYGLSGDETQTLILRGLNLSSLHWGYYTYWHTTGFHAHTSTPPLYMQVYLLVMVRIHYLCQMVTPCLLNLRHKESPVAATTCNSMRPLLCHLARVHTPFRTMTSRSTEPRDMGSENTKSLSWSLGAMVKSHSCFIPWFSDQCIHPFGDSVT
jgi:hypothetical protein